MQEEDVMAKGPCSDPLFPAEADGSGTCLLKQASLEPTCETSDAVSAGLLNAAELATEPAAISSACAELNLVMTVSYNGAPFSGFARQPGQLTVQGSIEGALALLFRREVLTVCAGRTDAGVHARAQVVNFQVTQDEMRDRSLRTLLRSLNALTHEAISIRQLQEADPEFSARFSAKWREYHYHICQDPVPPLFMRDFSWHVPEELDVPAMERASRCLIGEHDFKSFCLTASAIGKPTCRNVMEVSFLREQIMGEDVLTIKVVGSAFLHSMVRTMVGTLVTVGRGKRPEEWVAEALAACDRGAAGETAPAKGLVFWQVGY